MKRLLHKVRTNQEKILIISDQALVSGVNFLVGIILARTLGLQEYGLFALAWLLVLFFSSLHQAFIIMPLYTLYPKSENKQGYLSSLMGIQVIFSLLTFISAFAVITIFSFMNMNWEINGLNWALSLAAAGFIFNDYLRRLFFTLHQPKTILFMDLIGYGLQPIILLTLAYQNSLNIQTALLIIFLLQFGSSLFGLLLTYRNKITFSNFNNTIIQNWKFSKYLIGTSILQWLSGNLFLAVGASLLGTSALGAIRIAQNIVGLLNVLFLAMENIIPLRAAEIMKEQGKEKMIYYLGKITKQSILPILILLGFLIGFRTQIILLFYGSEFQSVDSILLSFIALYLLIFLGTVLRFAIRTLENNRIIFISYIITTCFSLLVAKPLIINFQLEGIMIGLFSVQVIQITLFFFSLKTEIKWLFR